MFAKDSRAFDETSLSAMLLILAVAATLLAPEPASATQTEWQPEWRGVGTPEVISVPLVVGGAAAADHFWRPDSPRWTGPIFFDEALYEATAPENSEQQEFWRTTSDIMVGSIVAYPFVSDYLLATQYSEVDRGALQQTALITVESVTAAVATTTLLKRLFARKRPGTDFDCEGDSPYNCSNSNNVSFPSGHTSTAFSAAFATCINHEHLAIHGKGAWNQLGCYLSLTAAGATGLFRMKGAKHYATDVLAGAAIGFGAGYVLPHFLHYRDRADDPDHTATQTRNVRIGMWNDSPMIRYSTAF